jgi:hypothetical protein
MLNNFEFKNKNHLRDLLKGHIEDIFQSFHHKINSEKYFNNNIHFEENSQFDKQYMFLINKMNKIHLIYKDYWSF